LPEIVLDIGAYAGLASVVGLAILSALYFSQARDVKRLREWAGRAPERAGHGVAPVPGRVAAQPQRPGAPAMPGGAKPGPPAVPGGPKPMPARNQPEQPGAPAVPGGPGPAALPGSASAGPAAATAAGARPATASAQGPAGEATDSGAGADEPGTGPSTATEEPAADAASGAETEAPGREDARPAGGDTQDFPGPGEAVTAPGGASPTAPAAPANSRGLAGARPGAPPVPGSRPPARPGAPVRPTPQQTAIFAPPRRDPWYRRLASNPLHLVLAIAGVLIVGGAAAFGVTQLAGDDGAGGTAQGPRQEPAEEPGAGGEEEGRQRRRGGGAVNPAGVTVAVLNGTTVPGLAATIMDQAEEAGFRAGTVANFLPNQQLGESVVQYTPGHERDAEAVSRRLGIAQREAVNPSSQELAGDATVVVLVGADKAP
jgi:hypothetical protein